VRVEDFHNLLTALVYPGRSQGKLGGKSAGLFLADRVLTRSGTGADPFRIRIPRTWYISSDALLTFIRHNDLEDLFNRKYQDLDQIRQDYPYVVQLFKNSAFPADLTKALSEVLDDSEAWPLIVRSSSLLEDRAGSAFSGKYKSLFLANQGTKQERLIALQDAVAEVYASIFSPDPIEYRAERRLLDVNEEMAVMIQEVVGRRVGPYFFPAFSGVAFTNNEFRWSPRIRREDGLLRMVPGLGTRAVDRLTDDYPVLVSPGQPGLRVNVTTDEIIRYAPRRLDLIDLQENCFRTMDLKDIFRTYGQDYPAAAKLVSVVRSHGLEKPGGVGLRWEEDEVVVTFAGLLETPGFLGRMKAILDVLREALGTPVDIEFACDGEDFYLLQCRPQCYGPERAPAAIPRNLPRERLVFTANRHISNGRLDDIRYIVYVDPEAYADLADPRRYREVGQVIGKLNKILPRKQFILMGPGRWGSRGDIKLGVPVTYSDISNTAMLVEIARRQGNYIPELSFGTHFFQDLVESEIRYLPLYPDEPEIVYNEPFLRRAGSVLQDLVPVDREMAETIRVIDISKETEGLILQVLMNEELEEAVGILTRSGEDATRVDWKARTTEAEAENHSNWRWQMAEKIAFHLDPERFGVRALYVYGSTKNWEAGPGSDIDLIIHFVGQARQRAELTLWLEGWSQALAEQNYLRTGYRSEGLLDLHFVTDADIAQGTSTAARIGAVTDGARPLPLRGKGTAGPARPAPG
jgi:predicted nucleotidyltransferase